MMSISVKKRNSSLRQVNLLDEVFFEARVFDGVEDDLHLVGFGDGLVPDHWNLAEEDLAQRVHSHVHEEQQVDLLQLRQAALP